MYGNTLFPAHSLGVVHAFGDVLIRLNDTTDSMSVFVRSKRMCSVRFSTEAIVEETKSNGTDLEIEHRRQYWQTQKDMKRNTNFYGFKVHKENAQKMEK